VPEALAHLLAVGGQDEAVDDVVLEGCGCVCVCVRERERERETERERERESTSSLSHIYTLP
jgi:hypothetical protein